MFSDEGLKNLREGLTQLEVAFDEAQISQLIAYWKIVEEVNQTMNLTRILGDRAITHHILDAASVIPAIEALFGQNDNLKVADIGTGCGVPGVVLKILKPHWNILLVDSLQKRVRFLQKVTSDLDLTSLTSIHSRAEDLANNKIYSRAYDVVVSRAVSALTTVFQYSAPLLKPSGAMIAMKGPRVVEELEEFKKEDKKSSAKIELKEVKVPFVDEQRYLAIYKAR